MFCTHCGNEISASEKFCTKCGQPVSHDGESKNITTSSTNTNFFVLIFRLVSRKKEAIKSFLKSAILFICLYSLSLAILNGISDSYYSDDNAFVALAPTILIIYLWRKLAKRFSL